MSTSPLPLQHRVTPTITVDVAEAAWRAGVPGTAPTALATFDRRWPGSVCGSAANRRVLLAALDGGPVDVTVTAATMRPVRL